MWRMDRIFTVDEARALLPEVIEDARALTELGFAGRRPLG
ncbi:hypothetical protein GCM10020216_059710 [Nonomuraea helvata]